jgi:hypothetical protein
MFNCDPFPELSVNGRQCIVENKKKQHASNVYYQLNLVTLNLSIPYIHVLLGYWDIYY